VSPTTTMLRATAACVAAATVFAVLLPAALVWSLDLEALVYNTYLDWTTDYGQRWYARLRWIPGLRAALVGGLGCYGAILLYAALFRFLSLAAGQTQFEPFETPGWRRAALILGGLSGLVALFPLTLALALSAAVEVYPWIEWHRTVDPLMELIHGPGTWLLLPSLALAGFLLLKWSTAHEGSPWRRPLSLQRPARLLIVLPLMILLTPAAVISPVAATRAARAVPELDGLEVFARECAACHERALPLYFVKSPSEWSETVRTHREVEGVQLSEAEAEQLQSFLEGMRSFDDSWTFRTRCQNCHGTSWRQWEPRSEDEWRAIGARLARWSPYFYNEPTLQQITRHLVTQKGEENNSRGLEPQLLERLQAVYNECDDCHSVSYEAARYLDASSSELRSMLERMGQKLAEPYTQQELDQLVDDYSELISSPARFDQLFPHDRPEDSGGGL
jgi:mono/diheme cytochrome c family protein